MVVLVLMGVALVLFGVLLLVGGRREETVGLVEALGGDAGPASPALLLAVGIAMIGLGAYPMGSLPGHAPTVVTRPVIGLPVPTAVVADQPLPAPDGTGG